jgi:hyperosmotically inducible periplasmic protein
MTIFDAHATEARCSKGEGMRVSPSARFHFAIWLSLVAPTAAIAQQPAPDNTKVNTRDRAPSQPTADQQSNTRSDVAITRDIRRAIAEDEDLSTAAHNIKIITRQGEVTLKGPISSAPEKQAVEATAARVAGAGHVKSEVSVTDPSATPAKRRAKPKA